MNNINEQISRFLSAAPRYKFVVASKESLTTDVSVFNVGHHLALSIKENAELVKNDFAYFVQEEFTRLFYQNISEHHEFGKYICIANLGILFESELKINVLQTFQRLSRNTLLILIWEGEIKRNKLYFLSEKSKHTINLLEINHIILS